MAKFVVETGALDSTWLEENTRQRIEDALQKLVTEDVRVSVMSPYVPDGDGEDVLVKIQSALIVHVTDIEDAPAAAIDLMHDSLSDESMAIRFDCHYMDRPGHSYAHVVVAGQEVGVIP
jgi:hypothetical protein